MSTKALGGRLAKLEAGSDPGFEPYRLEIVRGTEAEMEGKLAEIGRREGRWIAVKLVPAVDQSVNDFRRKAGFSPLLLPDRGN